MRFAPLMLAAVAIAVAAVMDLSVHTDDGSAEVWARVIEEGVPREFGPWVGEDYSVNDETLKAAGAVGKVSRRYTNKMNGDVVDLWLIVGHMQAVARHPPNVCYPAAGFKQQLPKQPYAFEVENAPPVNEFWTTWFSRESATQSTIRKRVFWAWTVPEPGKPVVWEAPKRQRYRFPGAKALFKMYFTTDELDDGSPLSENPSNDFADDFLPILAKLLENGPDVSQPASVTSPQTPAKPTSNTVDG